MATTAQWISAARPRTMPAAFSPVAAGTGSAVALGGFKLLGAVLALVVAVALQIGVNYANDYSDGIRGTDDENRVGPFRLVGSGAAVARQVRLAAMICFAVAAIAGVALVILSRQWWLVAVGVAAIVAAWYYTGGNSPYGYNGLGEVGVFVFFGLVAVIGTAFTQAGHIDGRTVIAAVGVGCYACALLMVNNLRDEPTDAAAGKRTVAVRVGARRARLLWLGLVLLPHLLALTMIGSKPFVLLSLLALPFALRGALPVLAGRNGMRLLPALRDTGVAELIYAVGLGLGLAV